MKKNLISWLLGILIFSFVSVSVFGQRVDDFEVELNNDSSGIIIVGYTGNTAKIAIPSKIEGLPVTEIAYGAFYSNRVIGSVVIPDSVIEIGESCFQQCPNLTSVTLPKNLSKIGANAFMACTKLTTINIPSGLSRIERGVFSSCGFTQIIIPEGVTYIGTSAFSNCFNLANVTLPKSISVVDYDAFSTCRKLTTVNLQDGLSIEFDNEVFNGSKLNIASQSALRKAGYKGVF
ncbi:MAG: leucine-rich repeat domain-containing protein [Dysgonamonadaceae bacterium]|jgi:hypothetical protein|nr:leucine-rich repeat domain-containing protein [Dysgonamonadaceae bacterium]